MIRITDQYLWNFFFLLLFLGLVAAGSYCLTAVSARSVPSLTWTDIILMALATHRLTRLFVYDAIMKWFREQFYDAKVHRGGKVTLHKPAYGPRRTISDLLGCPWCFGVWSAAMVSFFYLLTPYAYFPVLLLALASVGTMLQLFSNLIGHRAEQLKRQNEELF